MSGALATLSLFLACLAATASAELAHAGGEPQLRGRRHLQALRSSSGGDAAPLRAGLAEAAHSTSYLDATAARVCALQCQQHACISWHKVYFGEGEEGGSAQPAASIPAAAADCLSAACGVEPLAASCLAQNFHRLLNTLPLQYSCNSACVTGLLHSSCSQCGEEGCAALQLGDSIAAADCLVDAAP